MGEWLSYHGRTNTPLERLDVKAGDTIDFVTDCRGSVEYDSFNWSPGIKYISAAKEAGGEGQTQWNAKTDFSGPPKEKPPSLGPWEKYAQVLLQTNEFVFVD